MCAEMFYMGEKVHSEQHTTEVSINPARAQIFTLPMNLACFLLKTVTLFADSIEWTLGFSESLFNSSCFDSTYNTDKCGWHAIPAPGPLVLFWMSYMVLLASI